MHLGLTELVHPYFNAMPMYGMYSILLCVEIFSLTKCASTVQEYCTG